MAYIDIAVGVLQKDDKICLTQRQKHQSFADCWEFPGGKLEAGETIIEALQREFKEELDVTTHDWQPLIVIPWNYEKVSVRLHVFITNKFTGDAVGNEGQKLGWFDLKTLERMRMPEANKGIVTALTLSDKYMMSGKYTDENDALNKLNQALESGLKTCQLKKRDLSAEAFDSLAEKAVMLCHGSGAKVLLNGPVDLLEKIPMADGLQISAQAIYEFDTRPISEGKLLGVSTHSDKDIEQALKLGADFILLSPVKETSSHPGVPGLGWEAFADMVKTIPVPVYALGGMKHEDIPVAKQNGAQGVAAISGFWPG